MARRSRLTRACYVQFTQLASPNPGVIDASIRDLEYHDKLLRLLQLPERQDRDAVMIIHMGGTYGDKAATLARFRKNFTTRLSESAQQRLVLENDDVSWSVHDLLPVCEELGIPLVFDWHHHNIICDEEKLRPGSEDARTLIPRILDTWRPRGITPKMHYSEPNGGWVREKSRMDMRRHSPRVEKLPPCPPDMDLMIEAKDKEQAVFELMRIYKLEGWEKIGDIGGAGEGQRVVADWKGQAREESVIDGDRDEEEDGDGDKEVWLDVGGKEGRVFWPEGQEDVLKVRKAKAKKNKEK